MPTLVLTGKGTWPALTRAAEALPVGRHVEIPGGENHDIPVPETAAVIREFLTATHR